MRFENSYSIQTYPSFSTTSEIINLKQPSRTYESGTKFVMREAAHIQPNVFKKEFGCRERNKIPCNKLYYL